MLLHGVLYTIATDVSHLYVNIQTDISKQEVHRKFFIHWTSKFAEKKDEYVNKLREEEDMMTNFKEFLMITAPLGFQAV